MIRHSFSGFAYSVYAWCVGGLFTLCGSLIAIALPGLQARRQAARLTARGLLALLGMRLTVIGLENLPAGGCIVAANHASYLDGIILTAALPPRFGFVIKREILTVPLVALLLRRLGSQFVERFDPKASHGDASRLLRSARNGSALGIFPEGTFQAQPGIQAFRLGAFLAAARGGLPLVPTGIRGSRHCLPSGTWHPLPGTIEVHLGQPLQAEGSNRAAVRQLQETARLRIMALAGEPLWNNTAGNPVQCSPKNNKGA